MKEECMASSKALEDIRTGERKTKLQLADLQVQSFVTALDDHEASQVAGGRYVWTRVSACFEASVQVCYSASQDTFCYKCSTDGVYRP
jgi:hypothetical protein